LSDPYHDILNAGGFLEVGFPAFWWTTEVSTAMNYTQAEFKKRLKVVEHPQTLFVKVHPINTLHFGKKRQPR